MKKITHEEARKIFNDYVWINKKLADVSGHDWADLEEAYQWLEKVDIISNFINQQEKQEKLLNLYKELDNVIQNKYNYSGSIGLIDDLRKRIKELENE